MLIVAEVELILGLWLALGLVARACRRAAMVAFAAFFCAAVYSSMAGRATCGCLGRVESPSWIMALLDLAIFAALWRISPSECERVDAPARPRTPAAWLRFAVPCVLAGAALVAWAYAGFGSFSEMARVLGGNEITASPSFVDVGTAMEREKREIAFELTNHSRSSIRVLGGTSDCRCVSTKNLPVSIAPGERGAIDVSVRFNPPLGEFRRRVTFFTDSRRQPTVGVVVRGVALKKE